MIRFGTDMHDYRTTRGIKYGVTGLSEGQMPLYLFQTAKYLECLHTCLFILTLLKRTDVHLLIEDDALLHELVHLSMGIDISTHGAMTALEAELAELETEYTKFARFHQLKVPRLVEEFTVTEPLQKL